MPAEPQLKSLRVAPSAEFTKPSPGREPVGLLADCDLRWLSLIAGICLYMIWLVARH